MSDTRAIIEIIGIFILALTAFIIVTAMTWRASVEVVKSIIADLRSVPARVRLRLQMRRDPEFRRKVGVVQGYENALQLMLMAQAEIRRLEKEPTERPEARARRVAMASDAYVALKRATVERFCAFNDEELMIIAHHVNWTYLSGGTEDERVLAFLKEEQQLLAHNVHEASRHIYRIIERFGPEVVPAT